MPRDYKVYLEDMLQAVDRILRYSAELSFEAFSADEKTLDAIVRNLEILGEAARQVPDSIRQAYPTVDWAKISGLREVLIHQYFGIDVVIIWDIVQNKIPDLQRRISEILSD
jgi:uncharacterized protein with HEPN domain